MRFIVKMWQKKQCPMVLTPLIAKARQLYVSLYPSVCERALEIQPFIWPWGMLSWSWLLEYSQRLRGIRIWLLTFGCCRESVVIKLFWVIFWFKCKLPTWHLFWNWDKTFSVTLPFFFCSLPYVLIPAAFEAGSTLSGPNKVHGGSEIRHLCPPLEGSHFIVNTWSYPVLMAFKVCYLHLCILHNMQQECIRTKDNRCSWACIVSQCFPISLDTFNFTWEDLLFAKEVVDF